MASTYSSAGQRHNRNALQNFANADQNVVAVGAELVRKARKCRIKFGEAMRAAATILAAPLLKCRFTGSVVHVLGKKDGDQN